jgi:hypothetical protein
MLLRARDRKLRLCGERSTATRRWQPTNARVCVARAREATRGEELDRGSKRATRGIDLSRRWRCGGGEAAARGAALPAAGEQSRDPTCARRKKRGKGSGGLICDFQRIQGPLGKLGFLTATKVK